MDEINKNLYNNILQTGKQFETIVEDGLISIKTPYNHPYFNVAFVTTNFDNGVKTVAKFFENLCSRVILSKESNFAKYKKFLQNQGYFYAEETVGMIFDTQNYEECITNTDNRDVTTTEDIFQWSIPIMESFRLNNQEENLLQYIKGIPEYRHFYICHGGIGIASASLFFEKDTVGVYNLCVREEYRKHGYGMQLLKGLLQKVKKNGYSNVVLHSSEAGKSLYEKVGFVEKNRQGIFIRI